MRHVHEIVDGMLIKLAAERNAHVAEKHRKLLEDELAPSLPEWLARHHIHYVRTYDLPHVIPSAPPADCIDPEVALAMGLQHAADMAERNLALIGRHLQRCRSLMAQESWAYDGGWHMNLKIIESAETAVLIYARRLANITTRPAPANDSVEVTA